MSKHIISIFVFVFVFVFVAFSQERYDFSFRGVTLEQALMQIEDEAEISIVYNPVEVAANKRISLTFSGITVENAIRRLLGADYRVLPRNGIYTIRYVPHPPTPSQSNAVSSIEKTEQIEQIEQIEPIEEKMIEPIEEKMVEPEPELEEVVAPVQKNPEPPKTNKPKKLYQPTDHRLSIGVAPGVGGIYEPGCFTTTFDIDYAYFFHENWGIAAGLGLDYYGKSKNDSIEQILSFAIPITFRMDYRLADRLRLIGGAGASIEMPISGVYCLDETGERYSESILFGAIADIGVAVPLAQTNRLCYALGISAYGQCIFTSSDRIKERLSHHGLYPWQVGLRLSLLLNIRK